MKHTKTLLITAIAFCTLLTACKKYDDGPTISLRSREERVANDWRVDNAIDNGNDVTGSFDKFDISLSKGGEASLTAHYSFLSVNYDYTTKGNWSFQSSDDKIAVDYENDLADATYIILRLKETELWLRQENTNLELHLKPR